MTVVALWNAPLGVGVPRRGGGVDLFERFEGGLNSGDVLLDGAVEDAGPHLASSPPGDLKVAPTLASPPGEPRPAPRPAGVGRGLQVGGVGLHGHPAEGEAAGDGADAVRLLVGAGARDGEDEAELY